MTPDQILGGYHATLLPRIADMRASADRCRIAGDTDRAEMIEDDAANLLRVANALRDVLQERGAYVHPDEGQLVLFQFGKEAA